MGEKPVQKARNNGGIRRFFNRNSSLIFPQKIGIMKKAYRKMAKALCAKYRNIEVKIKVIAYRTNQIKTTLRKRNSRELLHAAAGVCVLFGLRGNPWERLKAMGNE